MPPALPLHGDFPVVTTCVCLSVRLYDLLHSPGLPPHPRFSTPPHDMRSGLSNFCGSLRSGCLCSQLSLPPLQGKAEVTQMQVPPSQVQRVLTPPCTCVCVCGSHLMHITGHPRVQKQPASVAPGPWAGAPAPPTTRWMNANIRAVVKGSRGH